MTDEEIIYTNTGDYYYNTVTNSTSTVLSFDIQYGDIEWPVSTLLMSINGGEAKPILINGTEMPTWTSENAFNFTALPLFTFITSDGKYGVEGVAAIGLEDMDVEYIKKGGLMYFRMIQGSAPELHYMFSSLGETSVTLSNGSVSYIFQTGDVPTQLNGTYLLGIVDDTTGEYTLTSDGPTVLDSTKFYMADWFGATSIEVEMETGDAFVVVGESMAVGGYGTIADYSDLSNLSVYDFERANVISAEMNTAPAESGDGVVLESLSLQSDNSSVYELYGFIVPTKITIDEEPDKGSAIEKIGALTYPGWSNFREIKLTEAEITDGAVDLVKALGKYITVKEVLGIQGDKYVAFEFDPATQKLKLFTATNTPVTSGTADVVILALTC